MKFEQEQKQTLTRELEAVGAVQKVNSLDSDQIKRELRARVADVKALPCSGGESRRRVRCSGSSSRG